MIVASLLTDADDIDPILTQPQGFTATVSSYCPPGLEDLLDVCQLVIHKSNFRKNIGVLLKNQVPLCRLVWLVCRVTV